MGNELFLYLATIYYLVYAPPLKGLCPPDMTYIPAGTYIMGSNIDNESPIRRLTSDSYCIDTYEFPNIKGEVPAVDVNWAEAERACEDVGKRLCTEEEWEKACRGPLGKWYTYDNFYDPFKCATDLPASMRLFPAGHFPDCQSVYGVHDMSGSVYEWTADAYQPYPGNKTEKPLPFPQWSKTVRSAGYFDGKKSYCGQRQGFSWDIKSAYLGFRCCVSFSKSKEEQILDRIDDALGKN